MKGCKKMNTNTYYGFSALDINEEMDINGGIGFLGGCLIVAGIVMGVSAGISAFNGYQEEKRASRK